MKKNLLILAAAVVALASCSSDETVASQATSESNEISFRALNTGLTRTANSTGVKSSFEAGDVINVYANYFNGSSNVKYFQDNFTKQTETPYTFTSSPAKYYWPAGISSTNKLTFTAIWGATQVADNPGKIGTAESKVTIEGNKDILIARHVSTAVEATPKLNFRHALSQVIVKVKNTNPNLKITITDIQVGYVDKTSYFELDKTSAIESTDTQQETVDGSSVDTGVALIPAAKWTNTAADAPTSNYSQTLASAKVFTGTNTNEVATLGDAWILLPQTHSTPATDYTDPDAQVTVDASTAPDIAGTYLALKMTIESYNGDETTGTLVSSRWCCWPIGITWEPGKKYTYTINAGDGGYEPADVDGTNGLDPVLGPVIVFSPDCTIDNWVVSNSDVDM